MGVPDPSMATERARGTACFQPPRYTLGVPAAPPCPGRWVPAQGAQGGRGWGQCRATSRTSRCSRGVQGRA